jgi:hypothetical protein
MTAGSVNPNDTPSSDAKGNINPVFRRKTIYPISEDPWVEVLVKNNSLLLPAAPFSFHLSEVVGIRGLAPEYSTLELKNGGEYIFKLSHAALSDRIYSSDVAVIDLKEVSITQDKKILLRDLIKKAAKEGLLPASAGWEIGESVEGEGIYLGTYELPNGYQKGLANVFNVFAAPTDITESVPYENAIAIVAGLKGWHGHDGEYFADAESFLRALGGESYKGGWVIPPREILAGIEGKNLDNIYTSRERGAFAKTLKERRGFNQAFRS